MEIDTKSEKTEAPEAQNTPKNPDASDTPESPEIPNAPEAEAPETEAPAGPQEPRRKNEAPKQTGSSKKTITRIIVFGVLIVIVIAAAALAIAQYVKYRNNKEGVPYLINSETVVALKAYPSGAAILTSGTVEYIDQNGNLMNSNEHSYASPVMVCAGKSVLLYDLGGTGLRIEKNSVKTEELQLSAAISCADINSKGDYAYVLNADAGHQSHLFAFSHKGKKLFEWSSSDYVLNIAMAPNGKSVAVCTLSVANAENLSRVLLYSFSKSSPLFSAEFPDETVFKAEFVSAKKLSVFTDKNVYLMDLDGGKECLASFSSNELKHTDVRKEGTGAAAADLYGNNNNVRAHIFSKGYKNAFEHGFSEPLTAVCAGEDAAALIFGSEIRLYNNKNEQIGHIILPEVCINAVLSDKRIFVLMSDGVYNYSIYSTQGEKDA